MNDLIVRHVKSRWILKSPNTWRSIWSCKVVKREKFVKKVLLEEDGRCI